MNNFDKKNGIKSRFARARRNARHFYQACAHHHGGEFTYCALKHALSEKHICSTLMRPFDRMVQ